MSKNIKQVIVMRKDLNMRKGKMIAQGAHASMAWLSRRMKYIPTTTPGRADEEQRFHTAMLTAAEQAWLDGLFTKVCVGVNSAEELLEIYRHAAASGLTVHTITDAGLTEFKGVETTTCLAIGPHEAEVIDVITGHLKLL